MRQLGVLGGCKIHADTVTSHLESKLTVKGEVDFVMANKY